uniref:Uncharacterized protein n=2 Tax=Clastoptera arizonana TaxID=38151 RepID=A0A1B6CIX9_9HEMI
MDHNPSPRDNAGYTPLHEACSRGHLDIVRLLLMYGANVSDSAHSGIRPLHEAVENGFTEIIRLLLSYGADPLLATYSGHTPMSLANDPETKALMQNHLADIQGNSSTSWEFASTRDESDPLLLNTDLLKDIPPPESLEPEETEVEYSEMCTPNLYQLLGEPHTDRWVLFQEIGPILKVKTRESLIKQLGQSHRNDFRDLKMTDFYDMAKCCTLLGVGDNILNPKAHKVTLVKYTDKVRSLLNIDTFVISGR